MAALLLLLVGGEGVGVGGGKRTTSPNVEVLPQLSNSRARLQRTTGCVSKRSNNIMVEVKRVKNLLGTHTHPSDALTHSPSFESAYNLWCLSCSAGCLTTCI